jgi:hypothetical protein
MAQLANDTNHAKSYDALQAKSTGPAEQQSAGHIVDEYISQYLRNLNLQSFPQLSCFDCARNIRAEETSAELYSSTGPRKMIISSGS